MTCLDLKVMDEVEQNLRASGCCSETALRLIKITQKQFNKWK
tara:strand:- start:484 stop:609 length:126 start_codon:yes stop_codon:yes gene_type:complete